MMNKIFKNTVNKITLISVIMGVLLALSLVFTGIFGANFAATSESGKTLTVTMNLYHYDNKLSEVQAVCQKEFKAQGVKAEYEYHGQMSGDECELVYVFDKDANLSKVKANLETTMANNTKKDGVWDGAFVTVATGVEKVSAEMPVSYIVRAAIAVVVFAVLAFGYVTLRYGFVYGLVEGVATLVGAIMSTAIVLLVRIPVTNSIVYVSAISALLTAVMTLFNFNKLRFNAKEGAKADSEEDTVVDGIATTETLGVAITLGTALVLVGAIATWNVRWFALSAILALIVVTAIALFFAPAMYFSVKTYADECNAGKSKSGYVGAKPSKKKAEEKTEKTEEVKEEISEEKAEETTEETEEVAEEETEE